MKCQPERLIEARGEPSDVRWPLPDGCDPRAYLHGGNGLAHPNGGAYWRRLAMAALPDGASFTAGPRGLYAKWGDVGFVVRGWPATVSQYINDRSLLEAARVCAMSTHLGSVLALDAALDAVVGE